MAEGVVPDVLSKHNQLIRRDLNLQGSVRAVDRSQFDQARCVSRTASTCQDFYDCSVVSGARDSEDREDGLTGESIIRANRHAAGGKDGVKRKR